MKISQGWSGMHTYWDAQTSPPTAHSYRTAFRLQFAAPRPMWHNRCHRCNGVSAGLDELKERIRAEGKNLGDGILKIDSLINHQLDAGLIMRCGRALAARF